MSDVLPQLIVLAILMVPLVALGVWGVLRIIFGECPACIYPFEMKVIGEWTVRDEHLPEEHILQKRQCPRCGTVNVVRIT